MDTVAANDAKKFTKHQEATPEKIASLKGLLDRFKTRHLVSSDLDDFSPEEDALLLRARKTGLRVGSEPALVSKGLKRQQSIQKYLTVRRQEDWRREVKSGSSGSLANSSRRSKDDPSHLEPLMRSGSLPILDPQTSTLTLNLSPTCLVRSTANLHLNGFSVTLEELEEMFQVWRRPVLDPGEKFI